MYTVLVYFERGFLNEMYYYDYFILYIVHFVY